MSDQDDTTEIPLNFMLKGTKLYLKTIIENEKSNIELLTKILESDYDEFIHFIKETLSKPNTQTIRNTQNIIQSTKQP